MKRTYSFELLCEILQDHETQSTGVVSPDITSICVLSDDITLTADLASPTALVVFFGEPSAADLRDDAQQELDLNARNKNSQGERGE